LPFENAQKPAEVADVRVLDVPGDDVRHVVAAHLAPQPVCRGEHALALPVPGGEEAHELLLPELLARVADRSGVTPNEERHGARLAGCPAVLAGEPVGVGCPPDGGRHRRVGPTLEVEDVLRVQREPRRELEPAGAARLAEPLDVGPRRLGVDVIRGHRRDAAPVVDSGVEEEREVVVREVRRRLHMHVGAEHDPRDGDRPQLLLEGCIGVIGHPGPGLRAEVLDDHLAQVPLLVRERPQGEERVEPLLARLADPDQDPARERNRQLAREPHRLEAASRDLVGRRPVGTASSGEPLGCRLEHDPHRGGHRP